MKFLDTNIILRYLTKDDPEKAARAYAFLQEVEKGSEMVTTTEAVITEIVHVLSSKRLYNYPRAAIVKRLLPVLQLSGLRLPKKHLYREALVLYAQTTIDFVDVLVVVKMKQQRIKTLVSFDRDYDQFPFITREEPQLQKQAA